MPKAKVVKNLFVVVLVLLLGVGAVIFALSVGKNQGSNVRAKFVSSGVAATVSATYQLQGQDGETALKTEDGSTEITFGVTDVESTKNLVSPNYISLSDNVSYVLFTYRIRNNAAESEDRTGKGVKITLADTSSTTAETHYLVGYGLDGTPVEKHDTMMAASTVVPASVYVRPQATAVYTILIQKSQSGSAISSTLEKGLCWTLEAADQYEDETGFIVNNQNVLVAYRGGDTNIVVPQGVTSVNADVFSGNTAITEVTFPSSVVSVAPNAFAGCTSLTKVTFEAPQTELSADSRIISYRGTTLAGLNTVVIGRAAFQNCTALAEVTLPQDIEVLPANVFEECSSLEAIILPQGLTTIGAEAFKNCSSLATLNIASSVTTIGTDAFAGCAGLENVTIPQGVSYEGAFDDDEIAEIKYVVGDGYFAFTGRIQDTSTPTITDGAIPANAFKNNASLIGLKLPSTIATIGPSAFEGCTNLENVILGDNSIVETIGDSVFKGCSGLSGIIIPSSVRVIEATAFSGCNNASFTFEANSSLTTIGDRAFECCYNLASITIPASVTTIGESAFEYCEALISVTFEDTTGWYLADSTGATSGTPVDVSVPETNATYVNDIYVSKCWIKFSGD